MEFILNQHDASNKIIGFQALTSHLQPGSKIICGDRKTWFLC